jgi:hypothetical protein
MNVLVRIPLNASPEQAQRLAELQRGFAEVCNALGPLVQQTRTWNRVALHHMAYKDLRQRFPALGSQMVCNAIYSVSRTARVVFQAPNSPFRLQRWGQRPLPRLSFGDNAPVYFDRHTLSVKAGQLSMFTLDGRMQFQLGLAPQVEQRFHDEKLREIVLARGAGGGWELLFRFGETQPGEAPDPTDPNLGAELPEYVVVVVDGDTSADPGARDPSSPPALPAAAAAAPMPGAAAPAA